MRWVLGPEVRVVQNMAAMPDSWLGRVIYDQKPAKNEIVCRIGTAQKGRTFGYDLL